MKTWGCLALALATAGGAAAQPSERLRIELVELDGSHAFAHPRTL